VVGIFNLTVRRVKIVNSLKTQSLDPLIGEKTGRKNRKKKKVIENDSVGVEKRGQEIPVKGQIGLG